MRLETKERADLARFFHKRAHKLDITKVRLRTGIPVPASLIDAGELEWGALIQKADEMNRLPLLATTLASLSPEDANLQSICGVLDDRKQRRLNQAATWMGGAGMGFVSMGLVGIVVGFLALSISAQPETSIAREPAPANTPTVVSQALKTELQPQSRTSTQSPKPMATQPREHLTPTKKTASLQPQSVTPSKKGQLKRRCGVNSGEKIGYFHWGPVEEGKPDIEVQIARSVNVRQEYPNRENAYNIRTPVKCILRRGETIQLSEDAILVAGGHYWVPLSANDLVTG